ncbi:hypothetical protein OAT16_00360 [Prolixibacteraceae bacterium]|nr:hypothetical protein [Prolixibacteraceae bacterium]
MVTIKMPYRDLVEVKSLCQCMDGSGSRVNLFILFQPDIESDTSSVYRFIIYIQRYGDHLSPLGVYHFIV